MSLYDAVEDGDINLIRAILRKGENINKPIYNGQAALHWASRQPNVKIY